MSHNQSVKSWCHLLVFLVGAQFTTVGASNGFSIGLSTALPQAGVVAFNLQAASPILNFGAADKSLQLAARADLTVPADFSAPPAAGLSALLQANVGSVRPYLGTGVGLSFLGVEDAGVLLSGFAYTGLRLQFTDNWGAAVEGSVNLSRAGIHPNLGIGVSYTFGAAE